MDNRAYDDFAGVLSQLNEANLRKRAMVSLDIIYFNIILNYYVYYYNIQLSEKGEWVSSYNLCIILY